MALPPGGRTAPSRLPVTPESVRMDSARARLEYLTDRAVATSDPFALEEAAHWATIVLALRHARATP